MRNIFWAAVVLIAAILIFQRGKAAAPDPVHSGSTAISITTLQTYRSVTVTPTAVNCGHYGGGLRTNHSANGQLGFPNGTCQVGSPGLSPAGSTDSHYPIKITYNGFQGVVDVHAGWAEPDSSSGVGVPWRPCSPDGHEAVRCHGKGGLPDEYQYMVKNFGEFSGQSTPITGNTVCDVNFGPRGCLAWRGNTYREGFEVTGPSWAPPTDTATSWSAWVIWVALPSN